MMFLFEYCWIFDKLTDLKEKARDFEISYSIFQAFLALMPDFVYSFARFP